MGKNKKKVHTKKEEQQAEKVVKIVCISLVVLALILVISFTIFN
ncbi:hypothetical protein EZS27_021117 [termite gut metagenome]|uniref:Uncharacterized protein n=1 Tax=termite gut metagenome TaxID=433724 RepID=A0A5J4R8T7_9ZZZZ